MRELMARVKVLFRRLALNRHPPAEADEKILEAGDLCLDLTELERGNRRRFVTL